MLPFLYIDCSCAIYINSPNNAEYFNLFSIVSMWFEEIANIK